MRPLTWLVNVINTFGLIYNVNACVSLVPSALQRQHQGAVWMTLYDRCLLPLLSRSYYSTNVEEFRVHQSVIKIEYEHKFLLFHQVFFLLDDLSLAKLSTQIFLLVAKEQTKLSIIALLGLASRKMLVTLKADSS